MADSLIDFLLYHLIKNNRKGLLTVLITYISTNHQNIPLHLYDLQPLPISHLLLVAASLHC